MAVAEPEAAAALPLLETTTTLRPRCTPNAPTPNSGRLRGRGPPGPPCCQRGCSGGRPASRPAPSANPPPFLPTPVRRSANGSGARVHSANRARSSTTTTAAGAAQRIERESGAWPHPADPCGAWPHATLRPASVSFFPPRPPAATRPPAGGAGSLVPPCRADYYGLLDLSPSFFPSSLPRGNSFASHHGPDTCPMIDLWSDTPFLFTLVHVLSCPCAPLPTLERWCALPTCHSFAALAHADDTSSQAPMNDPLHGLSPQSRYDHTRNASHCPPFFI